jgi:hypothetical protein
MNAGLPVQKKRKQDQTSNQKSRNDSDLKNDRSPGLDDWGRQGLENAELR